MAHLVGLFGSACVCCFFIVIFMGGKRGKWGGDKKRGEWLFPKILGVYRGVVAAAGSPRPPTSYRGYRF